MIIKTMYLFITGWYSNKKPRGNDRSPESQQVQSLDKVNVFFLRFFLSFSHDAPGAGPVWTPVARLAGFIKRTPIQIYKEDHYTLLLTKYESSGPCGFGEEDFFMFFPL